MKVDIVIEPNLLFVLESSVCECVHVRKIRLIDLNLIPSPFCVRGNQGSGNN